jgi:TRAP transporter TAXI family solute receptor
MESTSGYIDNAKRMFVGYGHMGLVAHDTARMAHAKKDVFAGKGTPLFVIAPIHKLQWHIIVNADSPIKTIWDLKDKRVNLQPKGSSAEKTGTSIFSELNIPITPSYHRHSEAAQALKTGMIDAHFLGGSTPVFMEYSMSTPIRVIEFSDADVKKIKEKLPHLSPSRFPCGAYYKGTPDAVQNIATWALLMCRADVSDDLVYAVAKGIHEHKKLVVEAAKGAEVIDLNNIGYVTVPVHKGAIKYYKEKGAEIPAAAMP